MSHAPLAFEGIGPVLRELRIERGLTQVELAERAEVSKSMVSLYEGGKQRPQLDTLERLLAALDVGLPELGVRLETVTAEGKDASRRRGPRRGVSDPRVPRSGEDERAAALRDILSGLAVLLAAPSVPDREPSEEEAIAEAAVDGEDA